MALVSSGVARLALVLCMSALSCAPSQPPPSTTPATASSPTTPAAPASEDPTTPSESPAGDPTPPPAEPDDAADDPRLAAWDKDHHATMLAHWDELTCFRETVKAEGGLRLGFEPGSPPEERWFQFKRGYVVHADAWLKRLFASEDRVLEKSAMVGRLLEAHEAVMHDYIQAYNADDRNEVAKVDTHWNIVEAKLKAYVERLGVTWIDPADPGRSAEHAAACKRAMPPAEAPKRKRR